MKKHYIVILAKRPIGGCEEDWPTDDNISCTYFLKSKAALRRQMEQLINAYVAPWWWIFDGDVTEDNLILSGAIDPDDLEIIKESI